MLAAAAGGSRLSSRSSRRSRISRLSSREAAPRGAVGMGGRSAGRREPEAFEGAGGGSMAVEEDAGAVEEYVAAGAGELEFLLRDKKTS